MFLSRTDESASVASFTTNTFGFEFLGEIKDEVDNFFLSFY